MSYEENKYKYLQLKLYGGMFNIDNKYADHPTRTVTKGDGKHYWTEMNIPYVHVGNIDNDIIEIKKYGTKEEKEDTKYQTVKVINKTTPRISENSDMFFMLSESYHKGNDNVKHALCDEVNALPDNTYILGLRYFRKIKGTDVLLPYDTQIGISGGLFERRTNRGVIAESWITGSYREFMEEVGLGRGLINPVIIRSDDDKVMDRSGTKKFNVTNLKMTSDLITLSKESLNKNLNSLDTANFNYDDYIISKSEWHNDKLHRFESHDRKVYCIPYVEKAELDNVINLLQQTASVADNERDTIASYVLIPKKEALKICRYVYDGRIKTPYMGSTTSNYEFIPTTLIDSKNREAKHDGKFLNKM